MFTETQTVFLIQSEMLQITEICSGALRFLLQFTPTDISLFHLENDPPNWVHWKGLMCHLISRLVPVQTYACVDGQ